MSTADGVLLSWDPPMEGAESVSGYEVLRRRPRSGEARLSVLVADTGSADASYLDTTATTPGEVYVYRVRALAGDERGQRSARARVQYEAPVVEQTVEAPVVEAPVVEAPVVEAPVVEAPVVEAPVIEQAAAAPVVEQAGGASETGGSSPAPLWSGSVTVGVYDASSPTGSGYSVWSDTGALSEEYFQLDDSWYRVLALVQADEGLYLGITGMLPVEFTLHVGDKEFASGDSTEPVMASRGRYWWATDGPLWAGGDTVEVSISVASDEPPAQPDPPVLILRGPDSLQWGWDPPVNTGPDIDSYELGHRPAAGSHPWQTSTHITNSATLTSLTADTQYAVRVRAHNSEGYSQWSQPSVETTSAVAARSGTFKVLAAGLFHVCAIETDGTVSCWGNNGEGRGDPPAGTYKLLDAGGRYTCAIATDDTIACWGSNDIEQLAAPAGTYQALTAGDRHACAIATDDTVSCWGYDAFGQSVPPAGTFTALDIGWEHTCAIATDGTLACWGYPPSVSPPGGTFKTLTAGEVHTCAIATNDTIACWGVNYQRRGATRAPTGTYKALDAGSYHTCAINSDDTIACWGYNAYGQSDPPAGTYKTLAVDDDLSCAIATDDTITCWGANTYGQADAPAGTYEAITVAVEQTCAIATDGTVACWGYHFLGQTDPLVVLDIEVGSSAMG